MKKLLILSGKGGTGKTTLTAAFIRFSGAAAIADCDVDAPNLHLVARQEGRPERAAFIGSDKARIEPLRCTGCGLCASLCRFGAIARENGVWAVNEYACEGCGVCARVCPAGAALMEKDEAGERLLYRNGRVFSTAALKMGRGTSGKLVAEVKKALYAAAPEAALAIIDGSPGIGCPVIASVSGVDLVLIVAEPSVSGLSDLARLLETVAGFHTRAAVCLNKWDTNPEKSAELERFCRERAVPFLGKIPYDRNASAAVNQGMSLADIGCPARDALRALYEETMKILN